MYKVKLFCLPYGGGSAMGYFSWKRFLDNRIDLIPVELAGRGKRIHEPLFRCAEDAVSDIYKHILVELDGSPYAVYGHSMGSLLAYELIRKIIGNSGQEPVHAFFSGRFPPFIDGGMTNYHMMSDGEFINLLSTLGGTSQELLDNNELMSLFLPVLRADYQLVETYRHENDIMKLNCDISVLNGKFDKVIKYNDMASWQKCTNKTCRFYEFDDGHFFINKYRQEVVNIINSALNAYLQYTQGGYK